MKLFNRIVDFFLPPNILREGWRFRKYKLFIGVCLVSALYALPYLPLSFIEQYHDATKVILVFTALNVMFPFLVRASVPLWVMTNAYILTIGVCLAIIMYVSGGVYHNVTDPQLMVMLPIMALLFLNLRFAIAWFLIGIAAITTFGVIELNGYDFPVRMHPDYVQVQGLLAVIGHLVIIFMVILIFYNHQTIARREIEGQKEVIAKERDRSDELLLNILPAEVMQELKDTGKTSARNYDLVTVLFADIVDFTSIVENLSPEDLVSGIDEYFERFDKILEKYDVEKIKTIGDAYVCASGLPNVNSNNPVVMVELALQLAEAVRDLKDKRRNLGQVAFDVRFGIHSGPVVAGVVGVKKFAYDIWGDTVNTAARMQQHGEAGRVNISGTTHDLIKHRFNCTYRGPIDAKHKGQVYMYFVEGKKIPVAT
jgi:class 3 adenylate cyclase